MYTTLMWVKVPWQTKHVVVILLRDTNKNKWWFSMGTLLKCIEINWNNPGVEIEYHTAQMVLTHMSRNIRMQPRTRCVLVQQALHVATPFVRVDISRSQFWMVPMAPLDKWLPWNYSSLDLMYKNTLIPHLHFVYPISNQNIAKDNHLVYTRLDVWHISFPSQKRVDLSTLQFFVLPDCQRMIGTLLGDALNHFSFLPQTLGKWSNLIWLIFFRMDWNHQLLGCPRKLVYKWVISPTYK